jgi:hypothetical protein
MRPWTLVAITNSSRRPKSFRARPMISSLLPAEYTFCCVEEVDPLFECLTDQRSAALLVECPRVGATFRVAEAHAGIDEAIRARGGRRVEGQFRSTFCGHGHFDMQAYHDFLAGRLPEIEFEEAALADGLTSLPGIPVPG